MRTRSGNAMLRTRTALLDALGDCLARYGVRKTTMVDVASRSGVAKATLYNHFRTKDDLLTAYVEDRVVALAAKAAATAGARGLTEALHVVAVALAGDPGLRRVAAQEPALLAPLAAPSQARGWQLAREGVAAVLEAARAPSGTSEVDVVLRWISSQLLWPATEADVVAFVGRSGAAAPAPVAGRSPTVGWPT